MPIKFYRLPVFRAINWCTAKYDIAKYGKYDKYDTAKYDIAKQFIFKFSVLATFFQSTLLPGNNFIMYFI